MPTWAQPSEPSIEGRKPLLSNNTTQNLKAASRSLRDLVSKKNKQRPHAEGRKQITIPVGRKHILLREAASTRTHAHKNFWRPQAEGVKILPPSLPTHPHPQPPPKYSIQGGERGGGCDSNPQYSKDENLSKKLKKITYCDTASLAYNQGSYSARGCVASQLGV